MQNNIAPVLAHFGFHFGHGGGGFVLGLIVLAAFIGIVALIFSADSRKGKDGDK